MDQKQKTLKRKPVSPLQRDCKKPNIDNDCDSVSSLDSSADLISPTQSQMEELTQVLANGFKVPDDNEVSGSPSFGSPSSGTSSSVTVTENVNTVNDSQQSAEYSPAAFDLPPDDPPIPSETPEWAKGLFEHLFQKLNSIESRLDNFATDDDLKGLAAQTYKQVGYLATSFNQLYKENCDLKEKLLRYEVYSRRDNLLFSGFPEQYGERDRDCRRKVLALIHREMGIDVSNMYITRCHRVGRYHKKQKNPRKIIVRFHYYGDREMVFESRRFLDGTNIYLSEDFPDDIVQRRKQLWAPYKAARGLRKYRGKVSMVEDRLIVDGRSYDIHSLNELPDDINPWHRSQKSDDNTVAFFTRNSPLSNHFPCTVTVHAVKYNCNEQFIMRRKAEIAGDEEAVAAIMRSNDPVRQKAIGNKLKDLDYEQWKLESPKVALQVVYSKFCENPKLANWLMATGNKTIVEASPDRIWGVGMKLDNARILDPSAWGDSQNVMGKALMKVRELIRNRRLKQRANSMLESTQSEATGET